jgi:hypothetical protein
MRCFIRIRRCQDLFRIFSREKNSPTVPAPIMPMRVVIVPMCTFNLFVGTGLDMSLIECLVMLYISTNYL